MHDNTQCAGGACTTAWRPERRHSTAYQSPTLRASLARYTGQPPASAVHSAPTGVGASPRISQVAWVAVHGSRTDLPVTITWLTLTTLTLWVLGMVL